MCFCGCAGLGNFRISQVVARLFREEIAKVKLHQAGLKVLEALSYCGSPQLGPWETSGGWKVSFCIFNDHNAGRAHNPRGPSAALIITIIMMIIVLLMIPVIISIISCCDF